MKFTIALQQSFPFPAVSGAFRLIVSPFEGLVQLLHGGTEAKHFTVAEWWVHQRAGDQWHGHPLHFDTNDPQLKEVDVWI